ARRWRGFGLKRQPEPQSALGSDRVLLFPGAVRDLFPHPALLHDRYGVQERRRGRAYGYQPVDHRRWDYAGSIQTAADTIGLSDFLQEHSDRDDLRRVDHYGGQRIGGILTRADEVLGFKHSRHRHFSDLSRPRYAVVHSTISDRQGRRPAELLLGHGASLPDAHGAVLHLDHARLFPINP